MKCVAGRVDRRRPSNAKTVDPPERLRASGEKNCGNRREGNPSWQPCLARSTPPALPHPAHQEISDHQAGTVDEHEQSLGIARISPRARLLMKT